MIDLTLYHPILSWMKDKMPQKNKKIITHHGSLFPNDASAGATAFCTRPKVSTTGPHQPSPYYCQVLAPCVVPVACECAELLEVAPEQNSLQGDDQDAESLATRRAGHDNPILYAESG